MNWIRNVVGQIGTHLQGLTRQFVRDQALLIVEESEILAQAMTHGSKLTSAGKKLVITLRKIENLNPGWVTRLKKKSP